MRRMGTIFEQFTAADVKDLIADYPLAWVVTPRGTASQLPLLGEYDADGRLVRLIGHLARRNPLCEELGGAPVATILITGPNGYVSPSHAELGDWGPTWNYAQLVMTADVVFEPDQTDFALDTLVDAMEQGRWTSEKLGERYAPMARAVIGFRAHVREISGTFKLGQDERRDVFAAILRNHPDAALRRWMTRFER